MPKLTEAQQTIVDKMANGWVLTRELSPLFGIQRVITSPDGKRCDDVNKRTLIKLSELGLISGSEIYRGTRYTLTPLGLSLARKDGK